MYKTFQFITWAFFFLFNLYTFSPIYIVQPSGGGTGFKLPNDTYGSTLANRTFRLPGIEEMDGDFHHHDSRGNDLIRIVKKRAVIKMAVDLKPFQISDVKPLSDCCKSDSATVYTRQAAIDVGFKHGVDEGFYFKITGLSPPTPLS